MCVFFASRKKLDALPASEEETYRIRYELATRTNALTPLGTGRIRR